MIPSNSPRRLPLLNALGLVAKIWRGVKPFSFTSFTSSGYLRMISNAKSMNQIQDGLLTMYYYIWTNLFPNLHIVKVVCSYIMCYYIWTRPEYEADH